MFIIWLTVLKAEKFEIGQLQLVRIGSVGTLCRPEAAWGITWRNRTTMPERVQLDNKFTFSITD
jgi:hypothetical protein